MTQTRGWLLRLSHEFATGYFLMFKTGEAKHGGSKTGSRLVKSRSVSDLKTARTSFVIWTLDLQALQGRGGDEGPLQETPDRKRGGRHCSHSRKGYVSPF